MTPPPFPALPRLYAALCPLPPRSGHFLFFSKNFFENLLTDYRKILYLLALFCNFNKKMPQYHAHSMPNQTKNPVDNPQLICQNDNKVPGKRSGSVQRPCAEEALEKLIYECRRCKAVRPNLSGKKTENAVWYVKLGMPSFSFPRGNDTLWEKGGIFALFCPVPSPVLLISPQLNLGEGFFYARNRTKNQWVPV